MTTSTYASTTTWNGGICVTCGGSYVGFHECSVMDLMRRSDEFREMALRKFRAMNPQPALDPTSGCPCRPENGGSGVCGCTLGGPEVTC